MRSALIRLAVFFTVTSAAVGQTYNSSTGGYNTGYGHMYGSFGMAMATQNMYNTMQMQMQKTMMRNAMIKKWGLAAVEKAERDAAGSSGKQASLGGVAVSPPKVPKNYGRFRPDATVDTGKVIGDTLGSSAEEKALLKQIYTTIKTGYEKEAAAKGWGNNIAGALTFFIVSNATVYHDAAEPSEEAVAALFDAINVTIDEIPDFAKMPNKDKQAFSNTLVAFAAIPLATYLEGKQSNDAATLNVARQLAGQLMELVLKTKPENVRFENGAIRFAGKMDPFENVPLFRLAGA